MLSSRNLQNEDIQNYLIYLVQKCTQIRFVYMVATHMMGLTGAMLTCNTPIIMMKISCVAFGEQMM